MESTLALLEEQQLELLRLARSRGDLTDFRTREDSLEGGEEDSLFVLKCVVYNYF